MLIMRNMKFLCLLLLCIRSSSLNITNNNEKFYEIVYKKHKNFAIDLLNNNYDFGKNFTVKMIFL